MSTSPAPEVWKALSDPTRRAVLDALRDGPATTGQLCARFPTSRFAVMKHLSVLEECGLVLVRPRGRERWHHLNAVPLRDAVDRWMEPFARQWATSLVRLRAHVENGAAMNDLATVGTMSVEQELVIDAPPERVFAALTEQIGDWWSHTFWGGKVRLEPQVGGRFWEEASSGSALFANVTAIEAPSLLRLSGGLGMTGAVAGSVTFRLAEEGDGTRLSLSHSAVGEITGETEQSYTAGWTHLLGTALTDHLARTA